MNDKNIRLTWQHVFVYFYNMYTNQYFAANKRIRRKSYQGAHIHKDDRRAG